MPVTFNGLTKRITITSGSQTVDIKADVYSPWKEWVQQGDNAKYLAALRSTGGDPLSSNQSLDGFFFLINNWKLVPPPDSGSYDIDLVGNIFVDGGGNIFEASGSGTRLARVNLSSKALVNTPDLSGITVGSVATASYVGKVASIDSSVVVSSSLTDPQQTMLIELYRVLGLDPTRPLLVSPTYRYAGPELSQSISVNGSEYTAQRT